MDPFDIRCGFNKSSQKSEGVSDSDEHVRTEEVLIDIKMGGAILTKVIMDDIIFFLSPSNICWDKVKKVADPKYRRKPS